MPKLAAITALCLFPAAPALPAGELRGTILDAAGGTPLAARLYIQDSNGQWFFAESAHRDGTAVRYEKQRAPGSLEKHTTLSAHPFRADLPAGSYTLTIERGKEYTPVTRALQIGADAADVKIELRRWINMSEHGWYSGETHVHRPMNELPNLMLAEDLNVALPLTYWVTVSDTPPGQGDKNSPADLRVEPRVVEVDSRHLIYPMNTEYEIFTVAGKQHTLGAVFALNHRTLLKQGVPPVAPIAEQVHREGGLLELDKHNWPWSMMLVPVMKIDLYELTNNHIWRVPFTFSDFGEKPAAYMRAEQNDKGVTEAGWIDYTFQNYYALLNSGFRLRPTAGTASGVHPVPLGFGRAYVHLGEDFSYDRWMDGLNKGRSFITTGPMLDVKLNGQFPGHTFQQAGAYHLKGWARSAAPLSKIEIIAAGKVVRAIQPQNRQEPGGGFLTTVDEKLEFGASTWVALRCYQPTASGTFRFAHTAPFHIDVAGKPLKPNRDEIAYLIQRVEAEIQRNRGVLPQSALAEYQQALDAYKKIAAALD
jgi:hypothetical protein